MIRSLLVLMAIACLLPAAASRGVTAQTAQQLMAYADPSQAGFSAAKLEEARAFADTSRAAAVVALYRGRVVTAWGAVDRPLMAHSVRKSLAGALYGIAVREKKLSLSDSLATLGIDDEPPLTAGEKRATFGDLIASRSGVYHGAAYADSSQER